ncbi:hypothetical protein GWN42_13445 [candidate division KSB1 bacterium]|nr:hypothetical protein [candidate division KSB1 bacterium]
MARIIRDDLLGQTLLRVADKKSFCYTKASLQFGQLSINELHTNGERVRVETEKEKLT